jgi:transcriptional regulator
MLVTIVFRPVSIFDKLQENLMKELTEADKHVTDETRELLVSLDEEQRELTEHQTNMVNIKMYATHKVLTQQLLFQTFECW